jgi:hypothetical protein
MGRIVTAARGGHIRVNYGVATAATTDPTLARTPGAKAGRSRPAEEVALAVFDVARTEEPCHFLRLDPLGPALLRDSAYRAVPGPNEPETGDSVVMVANEKPLVPAAS